MAEYVIGLYGGPLDGKRRNVDALSPIYSETLEDGTTVEYRSRGSGHSVNSPTIIHSYDFVKP